MDDAGFGCILDDATIQYERLFPHPIDRVWRAITDPAEVREWFMPLRLDLRVGGGWSSAGDGGWAGAIARLDPPRLLRLTHGAHMPGGAAGYLQYELESVDGGTRMLFTQHFPDVAGGLARDPDGVAGGWHEIFDSLAEWLGGVPVGTRLPRTPLGDVAEAWARAKVQEGEFDRATAKRYVLDLRREEAGNVLNRRYRERELARGGADDDAGLARFIDRWTIEYVRTYPHPIERVWRAVTEAAEVSAWFYPPAQIDPREGGAYALGGPDADFKGVITAFLPPRFVRYGGPHPGPESHWQFTLEPVGDGTRMVFVQRITPGLWFNAHGWAPDPPDHPAGDGNPWFAGTLSGWHVAFHHLSDLLEGAPPRKVDEEALKVRYRAHMLATQP